MGFDLKKALSGKGKGKASGGSGRGGHGSGGGGGLPPRKDPLAARAEEGLGRYWSELYSAARTVIESVQAGLEPDLEDPVAESLQHLGEITRDQGESDTDVMVRLLARFLDRFGPAYRSRELTPRDALYYMTDNRWNLEDAATAYLNGPDSEHESENDEGVREGSEIIQEEIVPPALDEFSNLPVKYQAINRLNPDVDREPAVKGQRTPAKLTISLRLPNNKGTKVAHFNKYAQGAKMDWSDPRHIRELNRWRTQHFRRNLGSVRDARAPFHYWEREWLIELYRSWHEWFIEHGQGPDWRSLRWDEITQDFNIMFGGQIMEPGGQPRPYRSKPSIMTERYRIREICDMAGLTPKGELKTDQPKPDDEEEEESDRDGDENGNGNEAPLGLGRGQKGKKPAERGRKGGRGGRDGKKG